MRIINRPFWTKIFTFLTVPSPPFLSHNLLPTMAETAQVDPLIDPATPTQPPRKRRRKANASNNRAGFTIPENIVAAQFHKSDWIIDGQYRRVPPYYYVLPFCEVC
jgi:hypothetical protein